MKPVMAGLGIGLAGAVPFTRLLQSFLFGVTPTSPPAFVAAVLVLLAGALLAAYVPARRATRIDPLVAVRGE
jgi:ABC-type antimicrobial peptide transport system permease subunit